MIEGLPHGFLHDFDAIQCPHRREHMDRVCALASPRVHEVVVAAPREPRVKEERLRSPRTQAGAKLTQNRGIERWVRELQAQDLCPIDAALNDMCRLTIGEPFGEWQERDERQAPGGQGRLSVRGEQCQKGLIRA